MRPETTTEPSPEAVEREATLKRLFGFGWNAARCGFSEEDMSTLTPPASDTVMAGFNSYHSMHRDDTSDVIPVPGETLPPAPIITLEIRAFDKRLDFVSHVENSQDWEATRGALLRVRAELDRIIKMADVCPFKPAEPREPTR